MAHAVLDHIVVIAPTLDAGCDHVRTVLGVAPQPGGEHDRMGTHNRLLRLGESLYLEVIAPNPAAARPSQPRWFGLDTLPPEAPPRLGAWVARVGDIRAALSAADTPLGKVEAMRRRNLEWLITIPVDGSLPLGGAAPALIEWQVDGHPAQGLADRGLALAKLEIHHAEPARVERLLDALHIDGPIAVVRTSAAAPHLVAHIQTPQGLRTL